MPGNVEVYGSFGLKTRDEILQDLLEAKIIGVDTETISLEDKTMIGLAIAPNTEYAVWFVAKDNPLLEIALSILRDPKVKKIFFNSKFDYDVLEPYNIDLTNFEDAEILAYTLNIPQKLYSTVFHLNGVVPKEFAEFSFAKGTTTLDLDPNFVLQKCCTDARLTLWCWYQLQGKVTASYYIDKNIVHILRRMEKIGVKLNEESVSEFYAELEEQTSYLRQLIQTKGCDPNSNQQVGVILAQRGWKLPYTKSKKQLRVDEKTLRDIDDPIAQTTLLYREKAKLKSTYAAPLLGRQRAFTHWNNTRVITGRLSSSDPINFQNIPDYFRVVFMADDVFYAFDARQMELRTAAYMANEKAMLQAFANGEDIHEATNRRLGLNNRKIAKTLNFAVLYLGEEETIIETAREAGIRLTPPQATDFRVRYFQIYPDLNDYIQSQRSQITKYGYVTTLFGRVRYADQFRMGNPRSREAVIRELFNTPIQGTSAEIIKIAMARAKNYDLRIQVHDELVFDGICPPMSMFSGLAPFDVPFKLSMGQSWGDLKEIA